jgi:hypothetical protein
MLIRVSQKTKILGAQVFPILYCPRSPNMTTKTFSVIIKRYMSNLKIVILRPWTDQFVIKLLSRATVHRKRFKMIEELGDKIRQDIMNTLKGKILCLHFDEMRVNQIGDDLDITVTVERIATSVTSPDFGDTDDYFELFRQRLPNQADVILNLLEYYDIVDQIFDVCCEPQVLTLVYSRAIVLLLQS